MNIKYKLIIICALLVALATGVSSFYVYYNLVKQREMVNLSLTTSQNNLVNLNQIQKKITSIDINNQIDVKQLKTVVANLSVKMDKLSNNNFHLMRAEINYFINMASQSLLVYHDIPTSIKMLEHANEYVVASNNPLFNKLHYALTKDARLLKQSFYADKLSLGARLDVIAEDVDEIKFMNNLIDTRSRNHNLGNWWDRFIYNLKSTLMDLIKVTKVTASSDALLPESGYLLKSQLRLSLLNARLSLLSNDNVNWRSSLLELKNCVANYAEKNEQNYLLIGQIDELVKINVAVPKVYLDETLHELLMVNNIEGE